MKMKSSDYESGPKKQTIWLMLDKNGISTLFYVKFLGVSNKYGWWPQI